MTEIPPLKMSKENMGPTGSPSVRVGKNYAKMNMHACNISLNIKQVVNISSENSRDALYNYMSFNIKKISSSMHF